MKNGRFILLACALFFLAFSAPSLSAERVTAEEYGDVWPFPDNEAGLLYCKELDGGRKAVWLTGSATYALNGPAMSWMIGTNQKGIDGGPVQKGRDIATNHTGLNQLIQDGLRLCD